MKDGDNRRSFLTGRSFSVSESADFAREHLERRQAELEYVKGRSIEVADLEETDVQIESSNKKNVIPINSDSPAVTDDVFTLKEDGREARGDA